MFLKANHLGWYMFQSKVASGIIFPKINRLIQAKIWCAGFRSLFKINSWKQQPNFSLNWSDDPGKETATVYTGLEHVTIIDG